MIALQIWWLGTKTLADIIARGELPLDQNIALLVADCQTFREKGSENALLGILARTKQSDQPVQKIFENLIKDLLNPLVIDCEFSRNIRIQQALLAILARTKELEQSVQDIVEDLTEDSLKILSLLTWHFDATIGAPPSPWLLRFFAQPSEQIDTVCEDIHRNYTTIAEPISVKNFEGKFCKILGLMELHVVKGKCSLV